MGIISLIVHTWGGVDKSHAVCPQKEALHSHHALEAGEHHVFGALTILLCVLCYIGINSIFVQLCGLALHLLRLKSQDITEINEQNELLIIHYTRDGYRKKGKVWNYLNHRSSGKLSTYQ